MDIYIKKLGSFYINLTRVMKVEKDYHKTQVTRVASQKFFKPQKLEVAVKIKGSAS